MTWHGKVTGGVVVLDNPGSIPEGAAVKLEVVRRRKKRAKPPNGWDELLKLAGMAKSLPPDMARNHDHYLHGRPKK